LSKSDRSKTGIPHYMPEPSHIKYNDINKKSTNSILSDRLTL